MTEAVVTNRVQAGGQDVLQIAACELYSRQGQDCGAVGVGTIFPTEADGIIREGNQAGVGDSSARDIAAEILESGRSGTDRLDVNSPVFAPDLRVDWPVSFFEEFVKMLTEGALQMR